MFLRMLCLGAVLSSANVYASTMSALFLDGLPASYLPGESFTVQVGLPPITDLGSYNIDLILTSDSGQAGTDFFFDVGATIPSPTDYVFPSATNFFDAATVDSPTQHRITLSDFDFTGVNVETGINDLVALVTIGTADDFAGDLSLEFDVSGLILDTPSVSPTPVAGFAAIASNTMAHGPVPIQSIPEASTLAYLLISLCYLCTARIRNRMACFANPHFGVS